MGREEKAIAPQRGGVPQAGPQVPPPEPGAAQSIVGLKGRTVIRTDQRHPSLTGREPMDRPGKLRLPLQDGGGEVGSGTRTRKEKQEQQKQQECERNSVHLEGFRLFPAPVLESFDPDLGMAGNPRATINMVWITLNPLCAGG